MNHCKYHISNYFFRSLFLILFWGISAVVTGQELPVDSTYKLAREWALAGKYDRARSICDHILDSIPEHYDARILIALTFSWEQNYDTARAILQEVLNDKPDYWDALNSMTDIEYWSQNYDTALYFSNQGLKYYPKDLTFLVKKAKILMDQEEYDEAERVILEILDQDPNNAEAMALMERLEKVRILNKVMLEYDFEFYEEPWSRRWHLFAISYERKTKIGSIIGRVYAGDMVRTGGDALFSNGAVFQYELE
ncbi:MAG: tetratricopeptide repeat protein, partial [Bacteroidetes bacterium]|nr:tetratricopeptide repeat protein [Bacteroidota bacterium]